MSKVLVDRELLDRVLNPETGEEWSKACRELRNVLAQPAEAEGLAHELWAAAQLAPGEGISDGVARLAALIGKPAEVEGVDFGFDDRSVKVSQEAYSIFLEREQHRLAALSAVTAERDDLRLQVEAARSVCTESQGAILGLIAERDQLRAEVDLLMKESEGSAERAKHYAGKLGKALGEAEALRNELATTALELRKASSWICREVEAGTRSATSWAIRLRERADHIDAAMAAKEA